MLNNFVLYRILGNDLPPRHKKGQTLENLQFILKHEPTLSGCEKRWVVNRIVEQQQEQAIIQTLEEHNQKYIYIPFVKEEYSAIDFNLQWFVERDYFQTTEYQKLSPVMKARAIEHIYHHKMLYVMNLNGARNTALREGRSLAKWVMPWDGNCFLTAKAWTQILEAVEANDKIKYFLVPMTRILNNQDLLLPDFQPNPKAEEPQILFRQDAGEEFNEMARYGHYERVELLWRLQVPGYWDTWKLDPWDNLEWHKSPEAGKFKQISWVARLFSGIQECDRDIVQRTQKRQQAVRDLLDALDVKLGII